MYLINCILLVDDIINSYNLIFIKTNKNLNNSYK